MKIHYPIFLISDINKNKFLAKTRKFEDTISMKLLKNNIEKKVYTNLIETVNENLSTLHEYYDFRKTYSIKNILITMMFMFL